jgi:hypothetical protein
VKKRIVAIGIVLTICVSLFAGCGKEKGNISDKEGTNKTSTSDKENKKKSDKSNVEIMVDIISTVAEKISYGNTENYAKFLYEASLLYEDDIANPYSGVTSAYIINRLRSIIKDKDVKSTSFGCEIIVVEIAKLTELNEEDIVYACNPGNKGLTVALVFIDFAYIYEVDENGNKKNITKYEFPRDTKYDIDIDFDDL